MTSTNLTFSKTFFIKKTNIRSNKIATNILFGFARNYLRLPLDIDHIGKQPNQRWACI
jgi:hypothetical protein